MSPKPKASQTQPYRRSTRGFHAVSGLVEKHVRRSGESRGFATMKLLTQWEAIVGKDTAQIATPVKVGYSREGFGATLTLLVPGAQAPMIQAELPRIRERVNACYGYQAISRIRLTQTAPTGFSEGQRVFERPSGTALKQIDPAIKAETQTLVGDLEDGPLKDALSRLSDNVLQRVRSSKGTRT